MGIYEVFLSRYKRFTPIQEKALPIIEAGKNCLITAPTGSGKTEAAILPLLKVISESDDIESLKGIKILYITPLKSLNRDMLIRLNWLAEKVNFKVAVRHGDTSNYDRSKMSKKPPDILITTPESLESMLPTKGMGSNLNNVKAVIIDEIHELYYNKRGAQLSLILERLEEKSPNFQRIGISATIGDIKEVENYLTNDHYCGTAIVKQSKDFRLSIDFPEKPEVKIKEMYDRFNLDDRAMARIEDITYSIKHSKSALLFANTRQIVEALGSKLVFLNSIDDFGGIAVHHSSLDKDQRIEIEDKFRSGEIKGIIATSSLELGIDIGDIDIVLQYSSPRQSLRLSQRIGRSGHSIYKISNGKIICTNLLDVLESLAIASNLKNSIIETFRVPEKPLDVLANQICGMLLDNNNITPEKMLSIIKRSYNYRNLTYDELVNSLNFLSSEKLIAFDGKLCSIYSRTRMYYYDHLSVLPDSHRYIVKNILSNKIISTLDEEFVSNDLDENSTFITKGLPWKVVSIDKDVISVEPSMDLEAAIPDWSGEDIPVSYSTCDKLKDILLSSKYDSNFLNPNLLSKLDKFLSDQRKFTSDGITLEVYDGYSMIYTYLGSLSNDLLSKLLINYLINLTGRSVNAKSSPYAIFIDTSDELSIKQALLVLGNESEDFISSSIMSSNLFNFKFLQIAKLFGLVDRDTIVSKSLLRYLINHFYNSPVYNETVRELMNDHYNISNLMRFLKGISSGSIPIRVENMGKRSPLSDAILKSAYYSRELIMPITPKEDLIKPFLESTLNKSINLICTYCSYAFNVKTSDILNVKSMKCPNCGSPLIVIKEDRFVNLINKIKNKKTLDDKDIKLRKEMMEEANLIFSYGGRAIIALSTYGIGHRSAARVLLMQRVEDNQFFGDLIESQKAFIKNKKYWSV